MKDDRRSLSVFCEGREVGLLESTNGIWSFEYSSVWLSSDIRFSLSPAIDLAKPKHIDDSTHRHVQWFFDNLLPEEKARILIAKDARLDSEDSFGLLEYYGAESAGALTLLKPGEPWPRGSIEPLSDEDLSARIKNLPKSPLTHQSMKKMSLAGAQHKLPVVYRQQQLFEPVGSMPSSHILKPEHEHADLYWSTVCNEWFIMTLARKLKIPTPETNILYIPEPVYLVKRFDRIGEYPDQQRRHVVDACQLLGLYAGAKYRQNTALSLVELLDNVTMKAKTRLQLFRWVLFNALIGNGDAHLKNLSFYSQKNGYMLCEHYDLLSTIIYNSNDPLASELSQPVGEAALYDQLTLRDLKVLGKQMGLPIKLVEKETATLTASIEPAFDELYQQVESWKTTPNKSGDLRMLREIKYKVLLVMLKRLSTL